MNKNSEGKSGFTLIELLVVISIIGILAALATVSFTSSQKQARDTQRKSDLKQYQNVLEAKANSNNGFYPPTESIANLCTDLEMGSCLEDPKNTGEYLYSYVSDGTTGFTGTKYVLWAQLENADFFWAVCSSGESGKTATSPSTGGGTCPADIAP